MSTNEMHAVIKELKEFKLLKEEAEARIAELENIIKCEMREQDTNKMVVGEYKCSLAVVTANRIDSKALQENRPDIYSIFVKPSTYERLTVK